MRKVFLLFFIPLFLLFQSCEEEKTDDRKKLCLGAILTLEDANGLLHKQGIETAVKEINDNGGILDGYFLEIDFRSSVPIEKETREEQANLIAQALIEEHKEKLIGFISASSSGSRGIVSVAEQYSIPTISGFSTSKANSCLSPYFSRTCPPDVFMVKILAQKTIEYGIKKIVIAVEENDLYSETLAEDMEEAFKNQGGEVLQIVKFKRHDVNYRKKIEQLLQNSSQAVFCSMLTIYTEFFTNMNNYLNSNNEEELSFILGTKNENILKQANFNFLLGKGNNLIPKTFGAETYPDIESAAFKYFEEKLHISYKRNVSGYIQCFYDIPIIYSLAIEKCKVNNILPSQIQAFREELSKQIRLVSNPEGVKIEPQEGWSFLREKAKTEEINYNGVSGDCDFDECGDVKTRFDIFLIDKNEKGEFYYKTIENISLSQK